MPFNWCQVRRRPGRSLDHIKSGESGGLENVRLFFHSVGNLRIPTDFHVLQRRRLKSPTSSGFRIQDDPMIESWENKRGFASHYSHHRDYISVDIHWFHWLIGIYIYIYNTYVYTYIIRIHIVCFITQVQLYLVFPCTYPYIFMYISYDFWCPLISINIHWHSLSIVFP